MVVGRMFAEDSTDYVKLKQTLLQRFRCTKEGYRMKFWDVRPKTQRQNNSSQCACWDTSTIGKS
ncbi:hypothetical protein HPB49_010569 [Dermacentor silvarum]|uniref:Uncharacterized protein n=1 Tax=Dermacentor silvarum TaxID=543639 RepID=A0ACB8C308_DERSI|nr:hypothetical protein HPB49_010569 [Dermacentor silvarum]